MAYPTTEEEIQAMGPEFAEGHYTSFNYFQSVDTPENKAFVKSFKAKFGQDRVTNGDGSSLSPNLLYGSGNGKLVEAGKEINTANLREATRGQVFKAPQGTVKIDPDNYHTYLYSRIAKWKSDGQADIVFQLLLLLNLFLGVKPLSGRLCVHKTPIIAPTQL
jgi:urea transport system substrate-binding protein